MFKLLLMLALVGALYVFTQNRKIEFEVEIEPKDDNSGDKDDD